MHLPHKMLLVTLVYFLCVAFSVSNSSVSTGNDNRAPDQDAHGTVPANTSAHIRELFGILYPRLRDVVQASIKKEFERYRLAALRRSPKNPAYWDATDSAVDITTTVPNLLDTPPSTGEANQANASISGHRPVVLTPVNDQPETHSSDITPETSSSDEATGTENNGSERPVDSPTILPVPPAPVMVPWPVPLPVPFSNYGPPRTSASSTFAVPAVQPASVNPSRHVPFPAIDSWMNSPFIAGRVPATGIAPGFLSAGTYSIPAQNGVPSRMINPVAPGNQRDNYATMALTANSIANLFCQVFPSVFCARKVGK